MRAWDGEQSRWVRHREASGERLVNLPGGLSIRPFDVLLLQKTGGLAKGVRVYVRDSPPPLASIDIHCRPGQTVDELYDEVVAAINGGSGA